MQVRLIIQYQMNPVATTTLPWRPPQWSPYKILSIIFLNRACGKSSPPQQPSFEVMPPLRKLAIYQSRNPLVLHAASLPLSPPPFSWLNIWKGFTPFYRRNNCRHRAKYEWCAVLLSPANICWPRGGVGQEWKMFQRRWRRHTLSWVKWRCKKMVSQAGTIRGSCCDMKRESMEVKIDKWVLFMPPTESVCRVSLFNDYEGIISIFINKLMIEKDQRWRIGTSGQCGNKVFF